MAAPNPDLEYHLQNWIADMEDARYSRLTEVGDLIGDRELSEASTSTLRPTSISRDATPTNSEDDRRCDVNRVTNRLSSGDEMDWDTSEGQNSIEAQEPEESLIIATDFGTTFSTVAFARRRKDKRVQVEVIKNYPGDDRAMLGHPSLQVPTESWYPDKSQVQSHFLDHASDEQEDDRYSAFYQNSTMDLDHEAARIASQNMVWGYGIQQLIKPDADLSSYNRVTRSKLLLDTSPRTEPIRAELWPILNRLKKKTEVGVIADYLTPLFLHVKEQLAREYEIPTNIRIEHVAGIPVVWDAKALRRMQSGIEIAIKESGLGKIEDLFFVSEPEAASAYILGKNKEVNPSEKFLIIDAGGGTVDATTYQLKQDYPLRLSEELIEPNGCLNGSSFLNEDFRTYLKERLKDERADIEQNGSTLEGIVDVAVLDFEGPLKRFMDVTTSRPILKEIYIPGLKPNEQKRFRKNIVELNRNDFRRIFVPHLEAIEELMKQQLESAKEKGHKVQKVVLIGGFSASKSLRSHLAISLRQVSESYGYQIRLTGMMDVGDPESAVARGAVLRALDKSSGPRRIIQSSYGFLRTEPYDPIFCEAHAAQKATTDGCDGEKYIKNTIFCLTRKGDKIPSYKEYSLDVIHTIPTTRSKLLCKEVLYVSDTCTESHYSRDHEKNKGKWEEAGSIVADMTFLKKQLTPVERGPTWKRHYRIAYQLVMIIDGRNLRYEARWPAGGTVRERGQTSIAAAFKPGTK